ncbi:unnamed protein product [Dibothriocephalus latus]|uniref:Uncharacterized protein n=1 Tax=Dibothriocephalus latus TaxID=60516 RepID=A0A3P7NUA0_DIBLA|nr:unnamed protein product [Dibothriocephalus latus]
MEFKINEDFAKRYNQYRQKEEYSKLKSRFGDIKLSKRKKAAGADDESGADSDSSSSSSSSTSSTAEEWEQREHEDFLRLYDALCRGDPAVNDPNKTWFRPRPAEGDEEVETEVEDVKEAEEEREKEDDSSKKKKNKKLAEKPVLLKDHVREVLLSGNSAVPEAQAAEGSNKLKGKKNEDPAVLKKAFLRETEGLFETADGEEAPLLQPKMSSEQDSTKASSGKPIPVS